MSHPVAPVNETPVIETERLILRPHRVEDYEPFVAFYAGEASRFVGGPLTAEQVWHGFGASIAQWTLLGFGAWAVEERATGAVAGQVSLNGPPFHPESELGWILLTAFEGRGYATEAARAARRFAFRSLGFTTLVSYIDPANARSIRLAERLGARLDPGAAKPGPETLVYRHPAPEPRP